MLALDLRVSGMAALVACLKVRQRAATDCPLDRNVAGGGTADGGTAGGGAAGSVIVDDAAGGGTVTGGTVTGGTAAAVAAGGGDGGGESPMFASILRCELVLRGDTILVLD